MIISVHAKLFQFCLCNYKVSSIDTICIKIIWYGSNQTYYFGNQIHSPPTHSYCICCLQNVNKTATAKANMSNEFFCTNQKDVMSSIIHLSRITRGQSSGKLIVKTQTLLNQLQLGSCPTDKILLDFSLPFQKYMFS